ncbi:MAG: glycosyltransferase, partial [Anaerolineae bacterium]|nr:glycosyltransferase [Anaerolineae bacterium]
TLSVLKDAATRVETVPNGVDCAYNRPGIAPVTPGSLVFNGSLTYDANYDAMQVFLSSVWPQLRQEIPSISLTITGSVAGVDLAGLALDSGVSLSGFVEDVRPLVAGAAVCVAPIRQGGGTRLKILEAMALGTPVVATSKAAEGLNVNAGEHLLIGDTAMEFASCVLRLLRDDELRARLARNARQLVEETYEWSQIGAQFAGLIDGST